MRKIIRKKKRPIDKLAGETFGLFEGSWRLVTTTQIKFWKASLVIFFIAGVACALIWSVSLDIQTTSEASRTPTPLLRTPKTKSKNKKKPVAKTPAPPTLPVPPVPPNYDADLYKNKDSNISTNRNVNINTNYNVNVNLNINSNVNSNPTGFEADSTPVDLRDYWPSDSYRIVNERDYLGRLVIKRIIKPYPNDPMLKWEDVKSGEDHYSLEDHFPVSYGSDETYYGDSWSLVKKPDKSVWEIADSFAPDPQSCTKCPDWCAYSSKLDGSGTCTSMGVISPPGSGIIHGKPGGHVLGEPLYYNAQTVQVPQKLTTDIQSVAPTSTDYPIIYSWTKMEKKYNTFTPDYGRHNGVWGKGNGKTYHNVVLMMFQHGVTWPSSGHPEIKCSNAPSWYYHVAGSTDGFAGYYWYAPGVGTIQEVSLFTENFGGPENKCLGYAVPGVDQSGNPIDPLRYVGFIDDNW